MAESSFDVVSSVDLQEVKNAISQAMKEITTRFDLKGIELRRSSCRARRSLLTSGDESKMKAVRDVLEEPAGEAQRAPEGARPSATSRRRWADRAPEGDLAEGHPHRQGARDRQDHQGLEDQGPGRDPGRPGARHRQEQGRPAVGDAAPQGHRPRHRHAVHQLQEARRGSGGSSRRARRRGPEGHRLAGRGRPRRRSRSCSRSSSAPTSAWWARSAATSARAGASASGPRSCCWPAGCAGIAASAPSSWPRWWSSSTPRPCCTTTSSTRPPPAAAGAA